MALLTTFGLILPIFLLILGGYLAKRSGFVSDGFWAPAEKLGYWVLLPALIVQSMATRQVSGTNAWGFVAAIGVMIAGLSLALFFARRVNGFPGRAFASIHQGSIRINGLLAIAVSIALLGPQSLPYVALMVAAWIPLSNGLSVYAYVLYAGDGPVRPGQIVLAVVKNPMIFSVFLGWAINALGAGPILERFILFELLGRAALPVGLLAVGAALNPESARRASADVLSCSAIKLIVMPLFMIALCVLLGLDHVAAGVAIISACMPTSPSGYLVAKNLRGDAELMASIVTIQTTLSIVTVTAFCYFATQIMTT